MDFDAAVVAPFRMQPGLRRLAAGSTHLTALAPGTRHQREKLAVLSAFPGHALAARAGFDAAPAVAAWAARGAADHPQALSWDGITARALLLGVEVEVDGTLRHLATGSFGLGDEVARCLRGLDATWRLPGLLALAFAEDVAVFDAADCSIPWLAVALPSHWAPHDKVGRHFAEVHAPVADNAGLLHAAAALAQLVSGGPGRWERFVWTVTREPRLNAHPAQADPAPWLAFDPHAAWFRLERQTFLPLPGRRQALFTIRVGVQPLRETVAPAGRAARLRSALSSMTPAVLAYRGLAGVHEPLLGWLQDQEHLGADAVRRPLPAGVESGDGAPSSQAQ